MREGNVNGNWKGGLCGFKTADELLNMSSMVKEEIKTRIMSRCVTEPESGCWVWTAEVFKSNGRARLSLGNNAHVAYRLSYVLFKGGTEGLCVLHSCDNVLCVNPEHLWLGTNADNTADMFAKGRNPRQDGSHNPMAKLNEERVAKIKVRLRKGDRQNRIAMDEGVSKGTINLIATGKTWRHVP